MTPNQYLAYQEEQRAAQAQDEWEAYQSELGERHNRISGAAKFDGLIGDAPRSPEDQWYWTGYCEGLRDYHMKQQGKQYEEEF